MAEQVTPDPSQAPVVEPVVEPAPTVEPVVEPPEALTAEQLRTNLTRANEQAAAERVKRQEALTELEEMRTRLSEMKSIEEVDSVIAEYQQKLVVAETTTSRLLAAQAAGLPAGFETRLQGSTYEEMLADAQALAPLLGSGKTPPVPLPPQGGRTPQPTPVEEPGSGYRAAKNKHAN